MKNNKKILDNYSMKLFFMLSGYFLLVLLLYTLCQFIKFRNCLGIVQILSIVIPMIAFLILERNKNKIKPIVITISIFLFMVLILPFIYNKTYDLSVDGNSYHKTAIAFIKNGWNPLYEGSVKFSKENNNVIQIADDTNVDLWIEHYPKATWITAATIYNMTGNIESGKCMTLIFSIMLMIISYNCINAISSRKWAILISILLALSPITIVQFFTYYVDSLMGILFIIELFLLFLLNSKKSIKENLLIWISLGAIICFFVNLKYTGLLASGVVAAVFYFYWLIKNRKEKNFWKIFKNTTLCFVIIFSTAVFFIGANSYVKNTLDHHNPLYPIIGKDKVDIITTMQPKSFGERGMIEKFFISLFSKTQNITYYGGEPELKLPVKVYRSEINELLAPDVRIGGFGPLFGLVFIISIIGMVVGVIKFYKNEKNNLRYITLPAIAIIISMILLGENWWARYVPQFYLFPVGTVLLLIYVQKYFKNKKTPLIFIGVLCTAMILNISLFLPSSYTMVKSFGEIDRDISEMKNTKDLKLHIATKDLYGYYYDLNDHGIKYQIKENIAEKNIIYKYSWRIVVEKQ